MENNSITGVKSHTIVFDEISDVNLSDITITTSNAFWASTNMGTTGSSGAVSTITFTDTAHSIDWTSTLFHEPKEFVDFMPNMSTVKEMCEVYPGFKKAFEYFKDVYDLVKGDYEARKNSDG